MTNKLKGKKLLILCGSVDEITLVKRAQDMGVYVIVTDYYTDMNISPAKLIADEAWDVSWADLDELERLCKENGVDGITAGYSEKRVEMMIKLCERLGLPCYITAEQLEITRDKVKFKNVCRRNNVPVVKEYADIEDVDEFPVIVKPVDRGGSIGISVASNYDELVKAYDYAMEMSIKKQVIIEKYMNCRKMDVSYVIEDGAIELVSCNDTIMAKDNGTEKVVQSGWVYPHREVESFVEKEDAHVRSMIKDMGITYGSIFFSGFIDDEGNYTFFECGFRLGGGHDSEYVYRRGLMNFLDVFIFHALLGSTEDVERNEPFNPKLKLATINFYAKSGTVSEISGVDEIRSMTDCTHVQINSYVGQECTSDKAILRKIGMCSFANEDSREIAEDIKKAYAAIVVKDENGEDMIYDRIDTDIIVNWWNK